MQHLKVSLSRTEHARTLESNFPNNNVCACSETYFYREIDKNSRFIRGCNVSFDESFANTAFTTRFSCERKNFQVQRAKERIPYVRSFLFPSAALSRRVSDRTGPTNASGYSRNYLDAAIEVWKRKKIAFRFCAFPRSRRTARRFGPTSTSREKQEYTFVKYYVG